MRLDLRRLRCCFSDHAHHEQRAQREPQRTLSRQAAEGSGVIEQALSPMSDAPDAHRAARPLYHAPPSSDHVRQLALHQVALLGLQAPFTWKAYAQALQQRVQAQGAPEHGGHGPHGRQHVVQVVQTALDSATFGRWIVTVRSQRSVADDMPHAPLASAPPTALPPSSAGDADQALLVVETLLLPMESDEEHLEHIAFHEFGHHALGHLARVEEQLRAPPPASVDAPSFPCLPCTAVLDDDALHVDQREREAERFALLLTRLAHGWDPAALPDTTLEHFFDWLS